MEDLIDRQALKSEIEKWINPSSYKMVGLNNIAVRMIMKIEEQPSVEPKRGKWLDSKGNPANIETVDGNICPDDATCSECGNYLDASDEYLVVGNFCPSCGADMRGDNNG